VDANDAALGDVVHVAVDGDLPARPRDEHLLLALVGVWGRHLPGLDDDLIHAQFGTAERLGQLPDRGLAGVELLRRNLGGVDDREFDGHTGLQRSQKII